MRSAGVDVDRGALVGDLRQAARDDRRAQIVELVRDAVVQAGDRAGIADQDLVGAARGGVAEERGLDIAVDQAADAAEAGREQADDRRGLIGIELWPTQFGLPIGELGGDRALQFGGRGDQLGDDERLLARVGAAKMAEAVRVECAGESIGIARNVRTG